MIKLSNILLLFNHKVSVETKLSVINLYKEPLVIISTTPVPNVYSISNRESVLQYKLNTESAAPKWLIIISLRDSPLFKIRIFSNVLRTPARLPSLIPEINPIFSFTAVSP